MNNHFEKLIERIKTSDIKKSSKYISDTNYHLIFQYSFYQRIHNIDIINDGQYIFISNVSIDPYKMCILEINKKEKKIISKIALDLYKKGLL